MTIVELLTGMLLVVVWTVGLLGLYAAMLGLVLLLTEWGEACRRRRERRATAALEAERITADANDAITRMQAAFWQARERLRDEADRSRA